MVMDSVKDRMQKAFKIIYLGPSYNKKEFSIERTNKDVPWPDQGALLKICDDGWGEYFKGSMPRHFGGSVAKAGDELYWVTIYTD